MLRLLVTETMESKPAKSVSYTSSTNMAGSRNAHDVLKNDASNDMAEQGNYNFCLVGDSGSATSRGRVAAGTIGEIHAASEPRWWR